MGGKNCNCKHGIESCPLEGNCTNSGLTYKAEVSIDGEPTKVYYGATETSFKTRWLTHQRDLRHERYRHSTALSDYIWKKREEGRNPEVRWSVFERARPYTPAQARCQLCISEKTAILLADQSSSLNVRGEIAAKCRHRTKYLLSKVGRPPD